MHERMFFDPYDPPPELAAEDPARAPVAEAVVTVFEAVSADITDTEVWMGEVETALASALGAVVAARLRLHLLRPE